MFVFSAKQNWSILHLRLYPSSQKFDPLYVAALSILTGNQSAKALTVMISASWKGKLSNLVLCIVALAPVSRNAVCIKAHLRVSDSTIAILWSVIMARMTAGRPAPEPKSRILAGSFGKCDMLRAI